MRPISSRRNLGDRSALSVALDSAFQGEAERLQEDRRQCRRSLSKTSSIGDPVFGLPLIHFILLHPSYIVSPLPNNNTRISARSRIPTFPSIHCRYRNEETPDTHPQISSHHSPRSPQAAIGHAFPSISGALLGSTCLGGPSCG